MTPAREMTMVWELVPADVERLAALVTERSGLAFPESRWPFLRNRAREMMVRSRFTSARRWLEELELSAAGRGALYCEMEDALQVHETHFFRYQDHHRLLAERVLPARVRTGGPRVRIASVGCATGEEPYSIAMTVRETVSRPTPCPVEIVALDASRPALAQAVSGRYPESRLSGVPPSYRERYFLRDAGGFTVAPALRHMVRFRHHDIRRGFYLGRFDAIFCCNVLLYFTPAMRQELVTRLADSLVEGGCLFLGHAEGVAPQESLFKPLAGDLVYERLPGSVVRPTAPAAAAARLARHA
jgi:chemotaxis protein methyltransferase CheR